MQVVRSRCHFASEDEQLAEKLTSLCDEFLIQLQDAVKHVTVHAPLMTQALDEKLQVVCSLSVYLVCWIFVITWLYSHIFKYCVTMLFYCSISRKRQKTYVKQRQVGYFSTLDKSRQPFWSSCRKYACLQLLQNFTFYSFSFGWRLF